MVKCVYSILPRGLERTPLGRVKSGTATGSLAPRDTRM